MSNQIENKLKERQVKPTSVRLLLLKAMMEYNTAFSLNMLEYDLVTVDKSTIFRTLTLFEQQKLIHKIEDGSGSTKYALCVEGCNCEAIDQHFHFHCTNCKETFCLTELNIPNIQLPSKFEMKQANVVLKGVCANCNL